MRDTEKSGLCPIADLAPVPLACNALAIRIFNQARQSAEQIAGEERTHFYTRPADVEALMRVHGVLEDERTLMMDKVILLQDEANRLAPRHPKQKTRIGRAIPRRGF